jgi:hypothetical protein
LELCWVSQITHAVSVMRRAKSFSSFSATSLQHQSAILGCHASSKTVGFGATSVVRLKCSFRHSSEYLLSAKTPRLIGALAYVKKASHFPLAHCRFGCQGPSLRAKRKSDCCLIVFLPYHQVCSESQKSTLFYYPRQLDQSKTSMLVSARLRGRTTVSN